PPSALRAREGAGQKITPSHGHAHQPLSAVPSGFRLRGLADPAGRSRGGRGGGGAASPSPSHHRLAEGEEMAPGLRALPSLAAPQSRPGPRPVGSDASPSTPARTGCASGRASLESRPRDQPGTMAGGAD
ncbi:hypothetical protein P7K49_005415, partial [Saguinus oedipus]